MMNAKQLEAASRKYCELRGLDPDATVGHGADPTPDGAVYDVMLYSKQWQRIAQDLKRIEAMVEAIEYGLTQ
jgi:hypothetical protein